MPDSAADPKQLWKEQPTEVSPMTLALIRRRARELQAKTRLERWTQGGLALFVVGLAGWAVMGEFTALVKGAFVLAAGWALMGQYFLQQVMRAGSEAGSLTGVEFYRRELERRGVLFDQVLQSFGPVVLALVALVLALSEKAYVRRVPLRAVAPFCILLVVWMGAVLVLRSRSRVALRQEIAELGELGRGA